ncbi:MAG: DUF4011 domain-containing protein [Cyclobacteriaceae bacterium]|nr:DUF4011 domain-containing protein [Cyclobacteriaceae bacterium]UYN87512.1 MAG: DUF4011 domain-containing protein [Cyclobacteriaceae bacterium]
MRRLTSLSGNNRLLLLLRLHSEQLMDLQQLSQLNGEPAFAIIKALIAGKDKKICPLLDSRMEAVNEASKKLKRLQRIDKFIFEERGSNDLHVGWPVIRGKLADGTLVRTPLLFFPVSLVQDETTWVLKLRKEAGTTLNKTFLLAFSYFNQVKPNEELLEADVEDFDTDSTVFRTQLYQLLRDRIEINFNPDTFSDQLLPFHEFKKEEFNQLHRNGELKLFPEAVLGIFPQAGSQLVPDYLQLIEENQFNTLEALFASKNQSQVGRLFDDPVSVNLGVKEEKVHTVFPMDAWQEHALKSVKLGRSLVVQGPPGSGKSQLISNLIADCIAAGKRVLLVCQKRVALDVVYDRLTSVGLSDFVGLIHDFRDDRKEIYTKIARQVDRLEEYKMVNRGIDAIQTERRFNQVCRRIDQLTEELEEFRRALFHRDECGLSVKELYLTSNPALEGINVTQIYQQFHFNALDDFLRRLKQYVRYAQRFEQDGYAWRNRVSFSTFSLADFKAIEHTVMDIPAFQWALSQQLEKIMGVSLNLEDCETLRNRREAVDEMVNLLADETAYTFFKAMADEKDDETSLLWLQNMERLVLNCFDSPGVEDTLRPDQIGVCQGALQQRMVARRSLIRMVRWELFSQHKFFLKRVLIGNGLPYTKNGLRVLEARIDNRLNLEHHLTALKARPWLIDLPQEYNQKSFKKWFEKQKHAVRAKLIFNSLREIRKGIQPADFTRDEFIRLIWTVMDAVQPAAAHREQWQKFLSPYQVNRLIHEPEKAEELVAALRNDFDHLREFDQVKEGLLPHEKEVINRIADKAQAWDADVFVNMFQNSLRIAWIEHIEMKYPVLRSASTLKMADMQEELQQLVSKKLGMSKEILLLRAREGICESIEYNRLNNRITYRDLYHQATKKKKIWPVRKLVAEYAEEVFKLIPCWMASPESVSAIFPMQQLFDLVIFDEASQCFAERGIPSLYRGRQVLIAGDTKQLRPFELYQARWDEGSEDIELEIDSLLELTSRYFDTSFLNGHYRSQSLELIDFSNHNFYRGKLQLMPDRKVLEQKKPAISYILVDGIWENQTNQREAEKVVDVVLEVMRQHPEKEIGVVSFNQPQQELVQDLLDSSAAKAGLALPQSILIKNIENVQGDERDVIIFSIGYAADKAGKMNMHFGSLNIAGGENRLNVAITRAREKIIVVASILPDALKLQGIKNDGPKLLKQWLEYAREVSLGKFVPRVVAEAGHHPDWYLSSLILRWSNLEKTPMTFKAHNLPGADIVLEQDDLPAGIIFTDDEIYEQMFSVKDAHVYTPGLLEQNHWTHLRLFSRNWWIDREKLQHEVARYIYQLNQAKAS